MATNYLADAFKEMNILEEEAFDITRKGLDQLKDFYDGDTTSPIDIIDIDAETEEELSDSYVGKVILKCPVCTSLVYEAPEDMVVDDIAEMVNVKEECPYCHTQGGFNIVGQVAEYKASEDEPEAEEGEVEETKVEVTESKVRRGGTVRKKHMTEDVGDDSKGNVYDTVLLVLDQNGYDTEDEGTKSYAEAAAEYIEMVNAESDDEHYSAEKWFEDTKMNYPEDLAELKKLEECNSSIKEDIGEDIEKFQEWVDYDMKRYHKISDQTMREIKEAGLSVVKDQYGDYEVIANDPNRDALKENFKEVTITTDTEKMSMVSDERGKTTVTTEPVESKVKEDAEVIEPVTTETVNEIEASQSEDEVIDVDIDDFDEESFDEVSEKYLKTVYENVQSYKTTKGGIKGNTLVLEGNITFKSGKTAATKFLFEGKDITKTNKARFVGCNKNLCKGNKPFTLRGKVEGTKFITESFAYNYQGKCAKSGETQRCCGTVTRK